MTQYADNFIRDSEISFDRKHRSVLRHNISKYDQAVSRGKLRYHRFEEARSYASFLKETALNSLPQLLRQFEKNISERGARVLWAETSTGALEHIHRILEENQVSMVVKSKSMISEEIELNHNAHRWGVESVETDLGEFIVQVAGEKPYHILTPAMHKSKEDVAALFHEKFGTDPEARPEELARFVRKVLRDRFLNAGAGITGANFLVADTGSVGLTENEGNALMSVSMPQIHIVIAGIERVIASVSDLPFFLQWLAVHGTGQNISAYNTLISAPRKIDENDGPEKMYVILLDNGRSDLLAYPDEHQALKCIRCGACLNGCPIYKNVGGYAYASTYTGPIGSVITPFYSGFREFGHLSFACTVCGRCSEVCPVKIPLHELLLLNRRRKTELNASPGWSFGMKAYRYAFSKRSRLDLASGRIKNRIVSLFPAPLGKMKQMPRFADHSFSQIWKSSKQ